MSRQGFIRPVDLGATDDRTKGGSDAPLNDLSRSLIPFDQATTLVAVIELSQSSWLIAGTIPGIERQPLKKIA
jgi:hypothetical protein